MHYLFFFGGGWGALRVTTFPKSMFSDDVDAFILDDAVVAAALARGQGLDMHLDVSTTPTVPGALVSTAAPAAYNSFRLHLDPPSCAIPEVQEVLRRARVAARPVRAYFPAVVACATAGLRGRGKRLAPARRGAPPKKKPRGGELRAVWHRNGVIGRSAAPRAAATLRAAARRPAVECGTSLGAKCDACKFVFSAKAWCLANDWRAHAAAYAKALPREDADARAAPALRPLAHSWSRPARAAPRRTRPPLCCSATTTGGCPFTVPAGGTCCTRARRR